MTPFDVLKQLEGLVADQEAKRYAWLRHLLLLASGSLSVLVSLGAGSHSVGTPHVCIQVGLASLGLGILFGAVALSAEVSTAKDLVNQTKAQGRRLLDDPQAISGVLSTVIAEERWYHRWSERLCYLSLLVAVGSFVVYAITFY
jgi:hypothetical protein